MSETFTPRSAVETCDAVKWAAAEEQPLEIIGTASKRALGRPVQAAHMLDLSGLAGIELYEPAELVLTAHAGTLTSDILAALADQNQELAFDPIDYGPLLGRGRDEGTLGGMIACNLAGSKRLKHGAARDHILGMEAVSGRGEIFKSGGRVVKNVTGYDLPRALTGSWGTLAVATKITLKVQPRSETEATFVVSGCDDAQAITAMTAAMGSSAEVSAAAHLPQAVAARLAADGHAIGAAAATLLRLEGFGPSVDYRYAALERLLGRHGRVSRVTAEASAALWQAVRDVAPFVGRDTLVWRVSLTPTAGAAFVADILRICDAEAYYDWSGGLVWLSLTGDDPRADVVRDGVARAGGGHATLIRAPAPVRASIPVFHPQAAPLAALSARVKAQFDPHGILNPGRMGS